MIIVAQEKAKEIIKEKEQIELSKEIGSFAVVVDPMDREAELFYEKYDFIKQPDSGKMFIATKTLQELFEKEF